MVRLWQGKAILAAILIPMLVYLCLTIVMKEKADYSWGLMLMANLSCCLVSSMGIILAPLLIGSFAVVKLIYKKRFYVYLEVRIVLHSDIGFGTDFFICSVNRRKLE